MFKENESGNRYDGTVNESLATDYSKRDASGAPPVIAVLWRAQNHSRKNARRRNNLDTH